MARFNKEKFLEIHNKLEKRNLKKHTIMLVDDFTEFSQALEGLLLSKFSNNYHIITAINGKEALDRIREMDHPDKISLIITDIKLPGINGIELLEEIEDILPNTIKIIFTAHEHLHDVFNSINKAKIFKILQKASCGPEEFLLTVKRAIETFELNKAPYKFQEKLVRVLLAEDDTSFGKKLVDLLRRNSIEVEWVETYSQLLHPARDFSNYDILILDLVLGEMGEVGIGIETIGAVKKRMPKLPILVLTAHATVKSATEAFKLGVSEFLEKPLKVSQEFFEFKLKDAIEQAIRKSEAHDWDKYISLLSNMKEDALIDQLILPLLRSMGFTHVRRIEHHGPGELGKDILPFFKFDDFMQKVFYAVQVKKGNLKAKNLQQVLNQAQAALAVSFTDQYDNTRKRLDKIVIIFSGKITPDAARILEDNLELDSRIIFVDNIRLLDLLRKHDLLYALKSKPHSDTVILIPCILTNKNKSGKAFNKEEVLAKLVPNICRYCDEESERILHLLLERERLASTGVGDYIAFPHTYIPDYCPYVVMVCYSDCPIYWSSSDGKPVRFFALSLYSNRDPNVKLRIQLALNKTFVKYKFRIVQKNDYKGDLLDKIVDSLYLVLSEQQISLEKQDTIFQVL